MKYLSSLLERFSQSLHKDSALKQKALDFIKEQTRVTLKPEQISIKNGVLEVEASPVAKNEIKLKEELLKKELQVSRILYK